LDHEHSLVSQTRKIWANTFANHSKRTFIFNKEKIIITKELMDSKKQELKVVNSFVILKNLKLRWRIRNQLTMQFNIV
jgi:hypothetical protein